MSWVFFTARLGSPQSELGAIRLGNPDDAFVDDDLALAVSESTTLAVTTGAADTVALSLSETADIITSPQVTDTLAIALVESLSVLVNTHATDTLSVGLVEDGANPQPLVFFTARLGWLRSKLSFIRLGSPDAAYLSTELQVGLGEGANAPVSISVADTLAIALSEIANQSVVTAPGPVLVDQAAAELVFAVIPSARLDQAAIETVLAPLSPAARVDQLARESIYTTLPSALIDQLAIELILKRGGGTAYVSGSVPDNITSFVY
jgi:hypothetical protein